LQAELDPSAWVPLPVFQWLAQAGGISPFEMRRTFNCGIGFVIAVTKEDAPRALELLEEKGEKVTVIGQVVPRESHSPGTTFDDGATA